ncbi:hypothetical protein KHQ81_14305 [Mycoplasmatota bacterium]|nr:hypothetical protein KHQ81_14305 [Mycoplasmatota bacterium]
MKRINDRTKRQLGLIIHYYRNLYFHSDAVNAVDYKQINFCHNICSQAQLSRLEHGEPLKDQEIYVAFLKKLKLNFDKVSNNDYILFETYFENILTYQNDDDLIINYNEYVLLINKFQNVFKKNIIYTHYNYALEFILAILADDIEEANYLRQDVEDNLDILPTKYLILTLQYLGIYYNKNNNYNKANKYYLLSIEHMHKSNINNSIIYIEIAFNYIKMNKCLYALDYLNKALEVFINTHNYEILERIYRCYGLINLINKYYDDGLNLLSISLDYSIKTKKNKLILNNYYLISVGYYLRGNYDKAYNVINKAENLKETEQGKLIKLIISLKLEPVQPIKFDDQNCRVISDFYLNTDDKETYFDKYIEPNLDKFLETTHLLVLNDMYRIYKENKKYKKALELLEKYFL